MAHYIPEVTRHFTLEGKIGEGTFSKVFRARLIKNRDKQFALKYVIPTIRPERIATELRYLRDAGGTKNVCGVESALLSKGHVIIVLPYFPHDKVQEYMPLMTAEDIRDYMKNLLIALSRIHSLGIIHRDIKPSNFLFNMKSKSYLLVDFGLAQDEKELQRLKKVTYGYHLAQMNRASLRDQTNRAQLNQVITRTDHSKTILVKKRSLVENECKAEPERYPKRLKTVSGVVPKDHTSSVFYTPDTPTTSNAAKTTPVSTNQFKTPTKQTNRKSGVKNSKSQVIVPETPQKSASKTIRPRCSARISLADPSHKTLAISTKPILSDTPKSRLQDVSSLFCDCFRKAQVCKICLHKHEMYAPRAGTPGFRAPEVLLKTIEQSVAIDVWSAGVIFISLLSGRYPFFRNTDDMTSLAEIITLLGTRRVSRAAKKLGKVITMDLEEKAAQDLKKVCSELRSDHPLTDVPDAAYELLDRLLDPHPLKRITAEQALKHSYFTAPIYSTPS